MEPEASIPNSQDLSICPYPEPDQSNYFFYTEDLDGSGDD
jgi:hypothetical protein